MHNERWDTQTPVTLRTTRCVIRTLPNNGFVLPQNAQELNELLASAPASDVLKNDRTTTVVKHHCEQGNVILKRYNSRNRWHKIKRAFRKSRARRCWKMSYEFKRSGLNVSPPIMMFENRYGFIRANAYFANQYLQGEELLSALPNMDKEEQLKVKQAVENAFKKLQNARISHGDMKATNLLWVNGELFFIDLDASKKHGKFSFTWQRCRQKDKRRFLKNWVDQPDLLALFSSLTKSV